MKIAVPIWNGRVSPLFDTACRVLITSGRGGNGEEHDLEGLAPPEKVRRIKELGAEVLICGAVSNPVASLVESAGIALLPWVSGPVDEVVEAFGMGQLDVPRFSMPGCGRMRRCRGRRGGGRGAGRGRGYGTVAGRGPAREKE